MSQIKSRHTKPELLVRKLLFQNGFRFRLHVRTLPGKPDIVIRRFKVAIFVQGCFWHGHENCKYFKVPSTKQEWWKAKIGRTKEIDSNNIEILEQVGWRVIEIWECELTQQRIQATTKKLLNTLTSLNKLQ